MNWTHKIPRGDQKNAHLHDTGWPTDGKSGCQCKPDVDVEKRIVRHKRIKAE